MNISKALDALKAHAERKANSAYRGGDGLAYLDWHPTERKAVSRFNIIKYLTRYSAHKGDKANNPDDLLKLAHYALLEWQMATAGDVELTPEHEPDYSNTDVESIHTIEGTWENEGDGLGLVRFDDGKGHSALCVIMSWDGTPPDPIRNKTKVRASGRVSHFRERGPSRMYSKYYLDDCTVTVLDNA